MEGALQSLKESLARPYGVEKGEWAYQFIKPRVITEKLLGPVVTDYRIHCSHGRARFVQATRGSQKQGCAETIFERGGSVLPLHLADWMAHQPDLAFFPGERAWSALIGTAERLSAQWRYVRVDLYWEHDKVWFGELTFWPRSGCYLTDDNEAFGEMLELDLTEKREPIVR
jgi:hypothetical protein